MASTSILLVHPKKEQSSIICQLTNGKAVRIRIPSGLSVKTKHWSKANNKVLSADPQAVEKNRALENLKTRVLGIYLESNEKGIQADSQFIKEALKPKEKPNKASKEFWNVWEYYLEDRKDRFKPKSFEKFKHLKNHLMQFEKTTNIPWIFDTVSKSRLEKFQSYFYSIGIGTQTAAKYLGNLKMFLNWAVENKYSTNLDFKAFKPINQRDTLKVVLAPNELEAIRNADLGEKKHLYNIRPLLILSTLTGLRYSDYSRISGEHLKKDDDGSYILLIRQEKTGDFIELPLTNEAVNIIKGLIDGSIHAISNQKMNVYVKELCKVAKVDEPFEVHQFKGKLTITTTRPKYELITTHTGRRTFATNLLLQGLPAETVMLFTGHKDYKSFSKYVNIPKKVKMDMVKNALNKMSVA